MANADSPWHVTRGEHQFAGIPWETDSVTGTGRMDRMCTDRDTGYGLVQVGQGNMRGAGGGPAGRPVRDDEGGGARVELTRFHKVRHAVQTNARPGGPAELRAAQT